METGNDQGRVRHYVSKAHALIGAERWPEAQVLTSEAITQFPEHGELCALYATAHMVAAPMEAIQYASRAATYAQDDPAVLVRAAWVLLGHEQVEEAGRLVRQASNLVDQDSALVGDLFYLLGRLAIYKGNDEVAEKYLRLALEVDPNAAGLAARLARFLAERQRFNEAADVVAVGLEYMPPDHDDLLTLRDEIDQRRQTD